MTPLPATVRLLRRRLPDAAQAAQAAVRVTGGHQTLKILIACVTGLLLLAATYTSLLIRQRQESLEAVSRYNSTWLLSQAATEAARLEGAVAAFAVPGSGVDRDDVQLRFEIVLNRIRMFDDSEVRGIVHSSSDMTRMTNEVRETIVQAQPMVEDLATPRDAARLLAHLSPVMAKLMRLASVAYVQSSTEAATDMAQLSRLHWVFSGVLIVLVTGGFGLIGLLTWHNRLLTTAHDKVNLLVADLTRTSEKLSDANDRVVVAMDEVRQRNEVLQARDDALNTQNARFDAALNNMSQALCMVDAHQQLIVCNSRFTELFRLPPDSLLPGMQVGEIFDRIVAAGQIDTALIRDIEAEQQALVFSHSPGTFLREVEGGPALAVSQQPMSGGGWVATYQEVTDQRHAEARIRFMAHHDALTGLANRVLLHERLTAFLQEGRRRDERLAVLCLDLDHFKNVNDTLGHPVGDSLLRVVAERLRHCIRSDDVVARIGGDEFAILQYAPDQPTQAARLAQRIVDSLAQPYSLDGQRAIIGASIGIAIAPDRGGDADTLLKCADLAMYRAKADGRNTHRFFEAEMDAEIQARRTMELDLREALSRDEIVLFYQPVFNLAAGRLCGFEALMRWKHSERGMIPPSQFIPLAEELGLIVQLGEWAVRQACRDAAHWPEEVKVAVNLSPVQFRSENLVTAIEGALAESGLTPRRLELEITETALLHDTAKVTGVLHRLREHGIRIVLDDFGTGYSSLGYLRSFPFDKLKIDQSFVREMATRPDCLVIVNSIAALAAQLGITTTAEGVETAELLRQVRDAGCVEAQGYYFDRPQPLEAIGPWLARASIHAAA
ncbi:MAG: putative bifunctional diguanylate cyclase/phosphodiesterase [Acetobacteraceae bacterium]